MFEEKGFYQEKEKDDPCSCGKKDVAREVPYIFISYLDFILMKSAVLNFKLFKSAFRVL